MPGTSRNPLTMLAPLAIAVLLAGSAAEVANAAQDKGFVQDRAQVMARLKRVGLLPAVLPPGFYRRDEVRTKVRELLLPRLKAAGFDVVPLNDYQAKLESMYREVGGVYDPMTGEADKRKFAAVTEHARSDEIDANHLDGLAYVRVLMVGAAFARWEAEWDGVKEPAAGKYGFAARFGAPDVTGKLPAYSLQLILLDQTQGVVFNWAGGIQLYAYTGGKMGSYRFIARQDALKDDVRLARAADVATLPLRATAQEIEAGKLADKLAARDTYESKPLPPLPEAAPDSEDAVFRQPRERIIADIKRVALAPVALDDQITGAGAAARYEALITAELGKLGWSLVPPGAYAAAWDGARAQSGGFYDTVTGEFFEERFKQARQRALQTLSVGGQPVQGLVEAHIYKALAPYNMGKAEWDGVQQNALDFGPWKKGGFLGVYNYGNTNIGFVPALSLAVTVFGADDDLLYTARGGIQLLRKISGGRLVEVPASDWFAMPEHDVAATHVALRALTLTPEALADELHPGPVKKP